MGHGNGPVLSGVTLFGSVTQAQRAAAERALARPTSGVGRSQEDFAPILSTEPPEGGCDASAQGQRGMSWLRSLSARRQLVYDLMMRNKPKTSQDSAWGFVGLESRW